MALMLAAGWGLLALVAALYPQYGVFYDSASYNSLAYQLAVLALALSLFTGYYGWLSRYLRPGSLVGGALLGLAVLLGLLQWRAPSSAFLLSWPLLAAILAWGLRVLQATSPTRQPAIGVVDWLLALPAILLLSQVIYLLLIIFGLGMLLLIAVLLLAILLALLLPVLLPVLSSPAMPGRRPATSWLLPGLALAEVLVALALGHATRQPTADQPQQTHLFYALDAAKGQAYWLSAARQPDAWTRHVLTHPQYGPLPALFPQQRPVLQQAAPPLALAPAGLTLLADSQLTGGRVVRFLLKPGRPAISSLLLHIEKGSRLRAMRVAGQAVPATELSSAEQATELTFLAPHPEGEQLELELTGPEPLQLAITTRSLGLPPVPDLPPLPSTLVPAPGYNSFTTQVRQLYQL
ncbi:hypothetical protein [Hymenobacter sp. BRD67]|uniref:hypothetical protein n=1 Tax=Hymenobacter sp. BRD67 TaxID=2675877 RepID=UPI0015646A0A|nr:hypothetical protein [Hymenobacter sp. BRD67]QKG53155.1 hypothetical protein GKZ67_11820 [Hymenobacter sp. BRD67]